MKTGHMEKTFSDDGPKKIRVYPSISVREQDFPEIKNWKVDDTIELIIKVKVTGVSRERWSREKKMSANVDIVDMRKSEKEESYTDEYARKMKKARR